MIGQRLMTRDEVGARLVRAMRNPDQADPDKVTPAQFKRALARGIADVPGAPGPLRDFFAVVDSVPGWVDFDLLNEGGRALRRLGRNLSDVLLQLSLVAGYRFAGPPDLLVLTGGLVGDGTKRRLAETQHWTVALAGNDAMRRDGQGFQLTVHVRLMHAMVNHAFEANGRWDCGRMGLPVNQSDLATTLGVFNAVPLMGARLLGARVTRAESDAIMHLWRYVGWLVGVDEDWLCNTEAEQHRLNYHLLITEAYGTPAGPPLAKAVVEAQRNLHFDRFRRARGRYAQARLLSMLSFWIGRKGMRDLGLRYNIPWAIPPVVAMNLLRYQVLGRTAAGRRYLQRHGDRALARLLRQYFGDAMPDVGGLE
jgi:hypothetical protein